MTWRCGVCEVEWQSYHELECWFCGQIDNVESVADVPFWAWGYRP